MGRRTRGPAGAGVHAAVSAGPDVRVELACPSSPNDEPTLRALRLPVSRVQCFRVHSEPACSRSPRCGSAYEDEAQTCHAVGPDTVVLAGPRAGLLPEPARAARCVSWLPDPRDAGVRVRTELPVGAQACHAVGPGTVARGARRTSLWPDFAAQAREWRRRFWAWPRPVVRVVPTLWCGPPVVRAWCLSLRRRHANRDGRPGVPQAHAGGPDTEVRAAPRASQSPDPTMQACVGTQRSWVKPRPFDSVVQVACCTSSLPDFAMQELCDRFRRYVCGGRGDPCWLWSRSRRDAASRACGAGVWPQRCVAGRSSYELVT